MGNPAANRNPGSRYSQALGHPRSAPPVEQFIAAQHQGPNRGRGNIFFPMGKYAKLITLLWISWVGTDPAAAKSRSAEEVILEVNGSPRRALVTGATRGKSPVPAVLILHGGMGTADRMRHAGFDRLAKSEGFMAVYPEGTKTTIGHSWNTGYVDRGTVASSDDIEYLDSLIELIVREYGADPSRIYMTGASNGGMMTMVYAVKRAERLAAVAPVVAAMFDFEEKPTVPLPILMINGGKDTEVPIEGGWSKNPLVRRSQTAPYKSLDETIRFWTKVNRTKSRPAVHQHGQVKTISYTPAMLGAPVEALIDLSGTHGWPGRRPARQFAAPTKSIDATAKIWNFFKKHRRPSLD